VRLLFTIFFVFSFSLAAIATDNSDYPRGFAMIETQIPESIDLKADLRFEAKSFLCQDGILGGHPTPMVKYKEAIIERSPEMLRIGGRYKPFGFCDYHFSYHLRLQLEHWCVFVKFAEAQSAFSACNGYPVNISADSKSVVLGQGEFQLTINNAYYQDYIHTVQMSFAPLD
jgi:hypothetical protein